VGGCDNKSPSFRVRFCPFRELFHELSAANSAVARAVGASLIADAKQVTPMLLFQKG
jgi:hypothetical protein